MKKKAIIIAAAVVIVAGAVLALTVFKNGKNNVEKFKTEAVSRGDIEAVVVTTGTLNPLTTVDVGSQVSGRIEKIYVDFNSKVKQGQVVAEIDPAVFTTRVEQNRANYQSSMAALDKAKFTLDSSEKKFNRAKDLFNKNLISYEDYETAETSYLSAKSDLQAQQARLEQAKSQLESSQLDLQYTIIKSPINGVVINRNVNVGQTVAASFNSPLLFQIAEDLSKMQVECSVDEADIGKVKEGQTVRFTVDAFPDEKFGGTVTQVRYSPEVSQNVVTYTTIVDVDNPELKLRPGMTATATIIIGEARDVLRVPNSALRFTPNLSPEEMQKIFQNMQAEMMAKRGAGQPSEKTSSRGSGGPEMQGGRPSFMMSGTGQGRSRQMPPRVWTQDESGKLRMAFLRSGVTDNTYTEVLGGDLKEGQLVITGQNGGSETQRSSDIMRSGGMMFIRR